MNGDIFKRRKTGADTMQCGCHWIRNAHGDVLVQCPIHQGATSASVAKFDRERAAIATAPQGSVESRRMCEWPECRCKEPLKCTFPFTIDTARAEKGE